MTSASERRPMDQSEIAAANVEDESKDWINQLPNCILESVVSLLNLRDAVRTSMVSPRWRYLWLNSTVLKRRNIELDIQNIFGSKHVGPKFQLVEDYFTRFMEHFDRRVFINRVNRFLELHHGEKIDSFKVTFFLGVESSDVLDQWIRFAFTKGVEDLCLHLFPDLCYVNWDDYVFPSWLLSELNSSTLKCLSLRRCKLGPPPDMHKFSQLTALHLYSVCVDRVFMEQLFSVCLLLESFTLNGSSLVGGTLTVVGPTLRLNDLKVIECRNLYSLNIDTVNLASLELIAERLFNVSLKAPQLIKSSLVITQAKEIARAVPVIASCPALETLHLAMHLDFPIGTPPTFRNLKLLALDVHTELCRRDINLGPVLNLLRVTPVLEELVLTILYGPKTYAKKGKIDNHSGFTHDSLKKVTVQGFQGHSYEMEFLICVLENATKLETMAIESFGKFYKGDGIWEKVMNLNASAWTKQRRKVLVELMLQEKLKDVRTSTRIVVL